MMISDPEPFFLYGTAWKEARTTQLTLQALEAGFRGIDTANQRKHYFEAAVGEGLLIAYDRLNLSRGELWLQTKFTHQGGQDHRLPYDPKSPISEQVLSSFESSLRHLHTDWIDSYVLHGPSIREGLSDQDWSAWASMEELYLQRRTRALGVSNVSPKQLKLLLDNCRIKPRYVQNRCYASQGWDRETRQVCHEHGITYQGFSLLTANRKVWQSDTLTQLAQHYHCTPAEIIFSFALSRQMLPLTGTTNPQHMESDLRSKATMLSEQHLTHIEKMIS